MAANPFVRALSLSGFEEFAIRQGLNPAEMLRRASLPAEVLRRQEGIVSYRRFCALLKLCEWQSGNPLFGLEYGLSQGGKAFGHLFYLIRNAKTVGDALTELSSNFSICSGAAEVGIKVEGDLAVLSYHVSERDMPGLCQAEELACGVGVQLMRTLVGSGWLPSAALLRHFPLGDETSYRQALGFLPSFAAACPCLVFDSSVLSLPLSSADETLHQLIAEHIGSMERLSTDEMPSYVKQLLRNLLPSGRVTIEKVADYMTLSPRTLQRRLEQTGMSFRELLDETRQEMVRSYLEDSSISVAQIAGLLGYSDLSTFCRAFNRWFEISPLEWQKRHFPNSQPCLLRSRRLRIPCG
ncbi:AraC family transcriptional regulator [Pseudomonas alcaligenes]|uniref:AraC family transcriptional regulator n=2 Tax=Aquipseudomonas alcaligenes TaxID=43263 RepID=A0ABR7S1G3_AQUAC|nr:AraC family transcriptional regulator [Pseudomonas alcaligenes]